MLKAIYFIGVFSIANPVFSQRSTSDSIQSAIESAVRAGSDFIRKEVSIETFQKHFSLNLKTSKVISGRPYQSKSINETIDFKPIASHLCFNIVINNDTLTRTFGIKIDSLNQVTGDTILLQQEINSWNKIFTNQYSFGHKEVLEFINRKKIKEPTIIQFMYEIKVGSQGYKYFWQILVIKGDYWQPIYQIDPNSGKVTRPPRIVY